MTDFDAELHELQDKLATIDLLTQPDRGGSGNFELLLKRFQNIRIRIDGSQNHGRAHVHIDYGTQYHAASYAIDTGERLVGDLHRKYDQTIRGWIERHRSKLLEVWNLVQAGKDTTEIVSELKSETP